MNFWSLNYRFNAIYCLILDKKYYFCAMLSFIKKLIRWDFYQNLVPLDRREITLSEPDFNFAIKLTSKYNWLHNKQSELADTIQELLQTEERKCLLSRLMKIFRYVPLDENQKNINCIINQIANIWGCSDQNTIIMATNYKDAEEPDGSSVFIYDIMRELSNWNTDSFVKFFRPDKQEIVDCTKDIVLCDDFIGTGHTIKKRVTAIRDFNPNVRIRVVTLAGMKKSQKRYLDKLGIEYYSPIWLTAGITTLKESDRDYCVMKEMENLLYNTYKDYSLQKCSMGWGGAAALYMNAQYRIPNSCFPIFWWGKLASGKPFNSLFKR